MVVEDGGERIIFPDDLTDICYFLEMPQIFYSVLVFFHLLL